MSHKKHHRTARSVRPELVEGRVHRQAARLRPHATHWVDADFHYPKGTELALFDIPRLMRNCTTALNRYGIGGVQFKSLYVCNEILCLCIGYFSALNSITDAEINRRGCDSHGRQYQQFSLDIAHNMRIVWQRMEMK